MKIPKYIDKALNARTKLACKLDKQCAIVDRWLSKNGVCPDDACWLGGVEIYANPYAAEENVREAILDREV